MFKKFLLLFLLLPSVAFADWDASTNMQAQTVSSSFTQTQNNFKAISNVSGVAPTTVSVGTGIQFEGATADAFEGTLTLIDPTSSDKTWTLPNASGTFILGSSAVTTDSIVPVTVQGDILYGSAANTLSALAKSSSATRYLSNTGTSNNPAWAQVNLVNGVTIASQAQGDLIYADSASSFARLGPGTSGQFLKTQGAAANPVWASILTKVEVLTTSGTWTAPTGVNYIKLTMCGGGGGGGGADSNGGGGGGGGACTVGVILNVIPAASYTVTVGAAGTANTGSTSGGNGGSSSFSGTGITTITANGGAGGQGGSNGQGGGAAGTGSTTLAASTTTGGLYYIYAGGAGAAGASGNPGAGGSSMLGKGGDGTANTGANGEGFGGGAAGGRNTGSDGGVGAQGGLVIEYNINGTPS